jgi:hypothetical protein
MLQSIHSQVKNRIKRYNAGKIIFPIDFIDMGSSEAVKKALLRLQKEKQIIRIAHGIYLYPKIDVSLGILYPSIDEIAEAISRRDKTRIIPTGVQAMNKLGLSAQVPMKAVFLTDGAPRSIKIGKRTVTFKKTSPKNLLAKGEISSLVIQALKSIGQKNIDHDILNKIKNLLAKENKEYILNDAKLAPAWINKILMNVVK